MNKVSVNFPMNKLINLRCEDNVTNETIIIRTQAAHCFVDIAGEVKARISRHTNNGLNNMYQIIMFRHVCVADI